MVEFAREHGILKPYEEVDFREEDRISRTLEQVFYAQKW